MNRTNKKVYFLISIVAACAFALYLASNAIIIGSFTRIEERDAVKNMERIVSSVTNDLSQLGAVASAYSAWDEAKEFIANGNPDFVRINLDESIYPKLRINLLAYVQDTGRVVYMKCYDLQAGKECPVLQSVMVHIRRESPLVHHTNPKSEVSGILLLPEGPMLVASRPVLSSAYRGPINGCLIMGRYLDKAETKRLSEITRLPITFHRFDSSMLQDSTDAIRSLSRTSPVAVRVLGHETISGYALFRDIYDNPALIARADMKREIFIQGSKTVNYFVLVIICILVLASSVSYFLFTKKTSLLKDRDEAEELSRAVINQASDSILLIDAETLCILDANYSFLHLLGFSKEEVHGMSLCNVVLCENDESRCHVKRIMKESSCNLGEAEFRHKNGTFVSVNINANMISQDNRHVIAIVARDISLRKAAEENRREMESRFHALFDNAPISLWEEDCSKVKEMLEETRSSGVTDLQAYFEQHPDQLLRFFSRIKVLAVNKATLDLFKATSKEELVTHFSHLFTERSLELLTRVLLSVANGETTFSGEDENRTLHGDTIHTFVSWCVAAGYEESYERVYVAILDITERKELENQLHQAQKMEAIGQLAGGVAHDFNNILTAILGYAHLILKKGADDDPAVEFARQIRKSAERAVELTQGLLSYSRKEVMLFKTIDINEVVTDLVPMLRRLIREDISLVFEPAPGALTVSADLVKIQQVLMNLVTNAAAAIQNGGKITLNTSRRDMGRKLQKGTCSCETGEFVCISVSDTGSGMTEETKSRIFEPFFTTKKESGGTGLGLAIIDGIIKQHNGSISVDSAPGLGVTFTVYLPATHEKTEKLLTVGKNTSPCGTETVLIAEDDMAVSFFHQTLLEGAGFRVLTASDGEEALECFVKNEDSIDVVISDVVMPKMNGNQLLLSLRARKPSLKVLFLSGYAAEILKNESEVLRTAVFLAKPVEPDILLQTVRDVLDGKTT